VLFGVNFSLLAYLFPHDAVDLNALRSRRVAALGRHSLRSDIDAGLALSRAVAKLVIERAEKDGSQ
jgi:hypothetical protein